MQDFIQYLNLEQRKVLLSKILVNLKICSYEKKKFFI